MPKLKVDSTMRGPVAVSVCDVFDCETCTHYRRGSCPGCEAGNKTRLSDGAEPCRIYRCVISRKLKSCKECTEVACQFPRNIEMICPIRAHFEKKRCHTRKLSEHFTQRQAQQTDRPATHVVLEKTVVRLRWYLVALDEFAAQDIECVSSQDISRKTGAKDYLIRRDLNKFGGFGRPSIGYNVAYLKNCLSRILYLNDRKSVIWVGATQLEQIKWLVERLDIHGFSIVAILDKDPSNAPEEICGLHIMPLHEAARAIREFGAQDAVIAVPYDQAQEAADILTRAGIRALLNLSPVPVITAPGTYVRNVDVVAELVTLHHQSRSVLDKQESNS